MSKYAAPLIVLGGFAVLIVGVIRWPWFGVALGVWFVLACVAVVMLNYAAGELTDQAQSLEEEAEYWRQYSADKGKNGAAGLRPVVGIRAADGGLSQGKAE